MARHHLLFTTLVLFLVSGLLPTPAAAQEAKDPAGAAQEGGAAAKKGKGGGKAKKAAAKKKPKEESLDDAYVTVVKGKKEKPREEAVKEVLTKEEIKKIPGTGGDLLKSVQNLPGAARPIAGSGMLVIRGSAPGDSIVLLEGHPIPFVYHFGTFSSVISTELIDEIEYVPGNFSVRYGRATGGMINVATKLEIPDAWHGAVDVDLIDAGAYVKGPLGKKGMIAASLRRSYVDAFLGALPDDVGFGIIAAPVYYDYQLMAAYYPNKRDELKLIFAGSDDRMKILFKGSNSEGDPGFIGDMGMSLSFHVGQLHYKHRFKNDVVYFHSLQAGYRGMAGEIGASVEFDVDTFILSDVQTLTFPVGDIIEMKAGLDLQYTWFSMRAIAPQLGTSVETIAGADLAQMDKAMWIRGEGGFVEAKLKAGEKVTITGGARLDYHGLVGDWEFHPRIVTRLDIDKKTRLWGGVGVYTVQPDLTEVWEGWGNPGLKASRAIHYGVGVERKFPKAWLQTSLQFFWKSLDRVVMPSDEFIRGDGDAWVPEKFSNRGKGRVYGMELMLKIDPGHRIRGWLAYTLSKSERWIPGEISPYPFVFDQPHVLTLVFQADLGKGWELGLRFRLSSGNTYQKVVDSIFYADQDTYVPIMEERPTSRLPLFHQLDLRLDKKWKVGKGWISLYVELQNAYYAKNAEGVVYNYDYTESGYFYGLPLFPSLGLEGGG